MQTLTIIQGSDQPTFIQILTEECNGTQVPFDLTGVTEITAIFRKTGGGTIQKKMSVDSGITVDVPASGKFLVNWTESDTAQLLKGESQSFEVEILKATKTYIVQFEKVLTVKPRLT